MIKPIRTSSDLAEAKGRLAQLIKSNQTGRHDDEIEVLATLAEQFEKSIAQLDAPTPVAAIRFRMQAAGLTPRQLEPFIGSRARVSEVLSGKRQLSLDMIRSLHEGLGIPYESLIAKKPASAGGALTSSPAMDRLKALGFDVAREGIPAFLNTLSATTPSIALHRRTRTQRAASKTDQTALMLWQAAVIKKSEAEPVAAKFDVKAFGADALRAIARLSRSVDGPVRALRALAKYGVSTVILPPLPGTFLDGAVVLGPAGVPVIGLTLRHDRIDSFWFTLLHEAAHVSLHYQALLDGGAAFVDDMEIRSDDAYEKEADELARESLIPSAVLSQIRWDESTTQDDLVALAVRARVHTAIAVGRWQREHQNYKRFARLVERGTLRDQLLRG